MLTMMLHTLSGAPDTSASRDCLAHLGSDDALMLLGDGVYNALDSTRAYSDLKNSGARLYALQQDVDAAGIAGRLGEIKLCDIDEFVSLSERYNKQMAWY
jgi:tRNA 2-thiouridine synthesizing protein B